MIVSGLSDEGSGDGGGTAEGSDVVGTTEVLDARGEGWDDESVASGGGEGVGGVGHGVLPGVRGGGGRMDA